MMYINLAVGTDPMNGKKSGSLKFGNLLLHLK